MTYSLCAYRSRDRFLNKYHAKLYQVPAAPRENNKIASLTPIPFDKINNSERNYNLNPSANRGLNRSFRQPGTTNITPLRGNRNYAEEKENQRAVNRTLEPYYSNDLNTEEDGEEEGDEFGEKNVGSHLNQQNKVIEEILYGSRVIFHNRCLDFMKMRENQPMNFISIQKAKSLRSSN